MNKKLMIGVAALLTALFVFVPLSGAAGAESADFANIASFRNTYDGSGRKGAAITNHFEYMDDGAGLIWNWTQNPGRTPDEAN